MMLAQTDPPLGEDRNRIKLAQDTAPEENLQRSYHQRKVSIGLITIGNLGKQPEEKNVTKCGKSPPPLDNVDCFEIRRKKFMNPTPSNMNWEKFEMQTILRYIRTILIKCQPYMYQMLSLY